MGRSGDLPRGLVDRFVARDGVWPDDTGCSILHVDMDAFYASVEIRERPELKDKPVVVGGIGNRGVVSSANYIARKYGVRSAMPTSRARRLCPHAVYVSPTFGLYQEVSRGVLGIFRDITPLVEPLSLDEAFLDVSGALRRMGMTSGQIGQLIRERVEAEHGITCSVGVAPTKFVAKLASGLCKPDGMLVVPKASVLEFLHPLPVSALWGVGKKTAERLADVGLERVADVAAAPLPRLRRIIGNALAEHLHPLAHGYDDRSVEPESVDKSVGAEETFEVDHWDLSLIHRRLAPTRTARPNSVDQGAVRRLHHDQPLADPARADRRDPGDLQGRLPAPGRTDAAGSGPADRRADGTTDHRRRPTTAARRPGKRLARGRPSRRPSTSEVRHRRDPPRITTRRKPRPLGSNRTTPRPQPDLSRGLWPLSYVLIAARLEPRAVATEPRRTAADLSGGFRGAPRCPSKGLLTSTRQPRRGRLIEPRVVEFLADRVA